ncbi:MAG: SDR family NAD(P)-dependent oxidoreductase [Bdellovibrionales bacterium]|nr:SDR family NAD(P)-dependent oxidoreductase [Bdellovibrionales bacterium]
MSKDIVLVTGATRGLGRATAIELARQGYQVIATGRNSDDLAELTREGQQEGLEMDSYPLNITDPKQIEMVQNSVKEKYGRLDALVNNAGIIIESDYDFLSLPQSVLLETLQTNAFAPLQMIQQMAGLLKNSENPRVVNVSSGMGAIHEMGSGYPAYRMSKTLLNVITILTHNELNPTYGIRSLAVCPGWVRTDMGGAGADRSLEEGIAGIVWAVSTEKSGPSAGFFRDGKPIEW